MGILRGDDEVLPGINDVGWFDERGEPLTSEAWQDPERRALTLPPADGEGLAVLVQAPDGRFLGAASTEISATSPRPAPRA